MACDKRYVAARAGVKADRRTAGALAPPPPTNQVSGLTAGRAYEENGAGLKVTKWPPRPQTGECAAFYRPYLEAAKQAGGGLGELLEEDVAAWEGLLAGVPAEREGRRYAAGKWSLREVVGHVTDAERMFGARALAFARRDAGPYPSFDEHEYAAHAGADERPLAALARELQAVRRATILLFEGFAPGAWERKGVASGCEFTVRALAWIVAGHSVHHRGVVAERYL